MICFGWFYCAIHLGISTQKYAIASSPRSVEDTDNTMDGILEKFARDGSCLSLVVSPVVVFVVIVLLFSPVLPSGCVVRVTKSMVKVYLILSWMIGKNSCPVLTIRYGHRDESRDYSNTWGLVVRWRLWSVMDVLQSYCPQGRVLVHGGLYCSVMVCIVFASVASWLRPFLRVWLLSD